ncbi:MAG: putative Na+/H+ antiporter [Vicinamibacterales bacterium]
MHIGAELASRFPRALSDYPPADGDSLIAMLWGRVAEEPFNAAATAIFAAAVVHTFLAPRFTMIAHRLQASLDASDRAHGRPETPSVRAELLHFLGEIEVVFGLWALVLFAAIALYAGWPAARQYFETTVDYTEALFVVVIMALASTRPILGFAESSLRQVSRLGGTRPAAWWFTILTVGPLLGSFITEPAAMTICALLLARQFFDLQPTLRLKYATLGLLFVNVSLGGTLTHFAAPPVLMVARHWGWGSAFMLATFGWRAILAIAISTTLYFVLFRRELLGLATHPGVDVPDVEEADEDTVGPGLLPVPGWLVAMHLAFMAWTVANAHYPVMFLGGFLFFIGFVRATAAYQSRMELKSPLLVGFFLAGLVVHGGLQGWWIAPVLGRLSAWPLFLGSTILTSVNDNALITYLATLVPNLDETLKVAVVQGAVVGGGLTVIANAPNPAGQALLGRFFDGAVSPVGLALGALPPTLIAAAVCRLL